MTKGFITMRRRNLSESDVRFSDAESDVLKASPSLENTDNLSSPYYHYSTTVECLISLPNDQVLKVDVDSKASGIDVLQKVCEKLAIKQEIEYFGLLYKGKCNELLWLNLRNRLCRQVTQHIPYRLDLRVKYFVEPHKILGEECRHLFFLHAKNQIVEGAWLHGVQDSDLSHIIAMFAQSEFGNYQLKSSEMKYALYWPKVLQEDISTSRFAEIAEFHCKMNDWNKAKVEYEALRLMADNWIMYGVFYYPASDHLHDPYALGVGPEGIYVSTANNYELLRKHNFEALSEVNYTDKVIELRVLQDSGAQKIEKYCVKTAKLAKIFQRYVTEANQFYNHDTVDSDILDLCKGVSLFPFRRSSSNKSFCYDVVRTSREVYEMARRRVYSQSSQSEVKSCTQSENDANIINNNSRADDSPKSSGEEVEQLRRELENLRELVQCVVCKDRKINRVFIPCMHILCCDTCSARLTQCPVCRQYIRMSHHAYPKWINDGYGQSTPLQPLIENEMLTNSSPTDDVFEQTIKSGNFNCVESKTETADEDLASLPGEASCNNDDSSVYY